MNPQLKQLKLKNRVHIVDKPQYEKPNDKTIGNIGLTEPEPNASFFLPMKSKYFIKKIPPKGDFSFNISLIGENTEEDNNKILTQEHFHECPVTCILANAKRGSSGRFKVNGCENPFTLYFDASQLKDCPLKLDCERTFYLPFRLTIKNLNNGKEQEDGAVSFEDYMEIRVKKYEPNVLFEFVPSKGKHIYSTDKSKRYQHVGELLIKHSAKFSCSPDIENVSFTINSCLEDLDNEGNKQQFTHNDRIFLKNQDRYEININNLHLTPGDIKTYPVVLDLSQANNPHDKTHPDEYKILITSNGITKPLDKTFDLYRNPTLTRCKTTLVIPSNKGIKSIDLATTDKPEGELWISRNPDTKYTINVCFTNTADADDPRHPNAAVLVWGVTIDNVEEDKEDKEDKDRIHTRGGQSLEDIFSFNDNCGSWALNRRKGDSSAKCVLPICFEAGQIESIVPSENADKTSSTVNLHLTYYMMQDEDGQYFTNVMGGKTNELSNDTTRHRAIIKLHITKDPQADWLCVDFGTSAVVAAYAQSSQDSRNTLIDLKTTKGKLLESVYGINSPKLDIDDEDNGLISSIVCFNANNTEVYDNITTDGSNYLNLPVWFSPSAADINKDYLLPCLKTIIGYRQLPSIFLDQDMEKFMYSTEQQTDIKLLDNNGKATPLMRVPEVTKVIYRQLFTYYLSQRYDNRKGQFVRRNVNKLVLSVPNTFTPLNIASVKRLAREAMPEIYPEHMRTVSESDAVACYYVAHHKEFLQNSHLNEERKESLRKHESVLVFDMGAGTLDLTWFEKNVDEDDKTTVTIKGKLGVNKAGNYLDYELGCILQEIYTEKQKTSKHQKNNKNQTDDIEKALIIDRTEAIARRAGSDLRLKLKNHVKEIKKRLSDSNAILPTLKLDDEVYVQLKSDDILKNDHFEKVINEMTIDVLQTFGKRYNKSSGIIDIDTIIFSGRSTRLKKIREKVKESIGQICANSDNILYADICSKELRTDIDQASSNGTLLKTIVTEGALAYASLFVGKNYKLITKPFYASYGLLKHGREIGHYEYVPLIEPADIIDYGTTIESPIVDVSTDYFEQIDLIQSYSCDPVEDYKNGNYDTISKLYKENITAGRPNFAVQLKMNINYDGDESVGLEFTIGQGIVHLDAHDDFDNESLRKSLWPVIFDNNKE